MYYLLTFFVFVEDFAMEGGVVHLTLGGGEGDEGGLPPPPTTALAHGGAGVACLHHLLQVTVLKRGQH